MLQAEPTFKILKDAITEKQNRCFFLHPNPCFLMLGGTKLYVQETFQFFPPTNCWFRARLMWWHARQSARKQWIMEKALKIPILLGRAVQPSMKAIIWTQLISAGSIPSQQDPGWLPLAQPLVPPCFGSRRGLLTQVHHLAGPGFAWN